MTGIFGVQHDGEASNDLQVSSGLGGSTTSWRPSPRQSRQSRTHRHALRRGLHMPATMPPVPHTTGPGSALAQRSAPHVPSTSFRTSRDRPGLDHFAEHANIDFRVDCRRLRGSVTKKGTDSFQRSTGTQEACGRRVAEYMCRRSRAPSTLAHSSARRAIDETAPEPPTGTWRGATERSNTLSAVTRGRACRISSFKASPTSWGSGRVAGTLDFPDTRMVASFQSMSPNRRLATSPARSASRASSNRIARSRIPTRVVTSPRPAGDRRRGCSPCRGSRSPLRRSFAANVGRESPEGYGPPVVGLLRAGSHAAGVLGEAEGRRQRRELRAGDLAQSGERRVGAEAGTEGGDGGGAAEEAIRMHAAHGVEGARHQPDRHRSQRIAPAGSERPPCSVAAAAATLRASSALATASSSSAIVPGSRAASSPAAG